MFGLRVYIDFATKSLESIYTEHQSEKSNAARCVRIVDAPIILSLGIVSVFY